MINFLLQTLALIIHVILLAFKNVKMVMKQFQSCYVPLVQLKIGWPLLKNLNTLVVQVFRVAASIDSLVFSCVLKTAD